MTKRTSAHLERLRQFLKDYWLLWLFFAVVILINIVAPTGRFAGATEEIAILLAAGALFYLAFVAVRRLLVASPHLAKDHRPVSPEPSSWTADLDSLPMIARLDAVERELLVARMKIFLDQVHFEGCDELEVTLRIRLAIAAQACLMALYLPDDCYRGIKEILVYPTTFAPAQFSWTPSQDRDTRPSTPTLGESWKRGTVVLAWDSTLSGAVNPTDGHNLVFHEFAHQLDAAGGAIDGAPALPTSERIRRWTETLGEDLKRLRRDLRRGRPTALDPYAATNEAEFFAVATETFFEQSELLHRRHPELYAELLAFYRQDPKRLVESHS